MPAVVIGFSTLQYPLRQFHRCNTLKKSTYIPGAITSGGKVGSQMFVSVFVSLGRRSRIPLLSVVLQV